MSSRSSRRRSPDLKVVVLGSGTSAGVPVIGCQCEVCRSDDPRDKRTRASICVEFPDARGEHRLILVDTSPDLRAQALRHNLMRCDAIVFTHDHVDHTFGLDEVRRFNSMMRKSIDIYAEEPTMVTLHRIYRHIFDKQKNVNRSYVATLNSHLIHVGRALHLFDLQFTPLRLHHGEQSILGYRIDRLDSDQAPVADQPTPLPMAYLTDVSTIPPETWSELTGIRTLILDMLRYDKHPTHLSVDEAVETARRIDARQTWFTHMTHDIRHADLDGKLPQGMALSYDGLVIE